VKLVTVAPELFCAVTWTAGLILTPAVVALGCTVKTSWVVAAAVMLKAVLVAPVYGGDVAVSV
jgi:hypothetical protein